MTGTLATLTLAALLAGQTAPPAVDPHRLNPVYARLVERGWTVGEVNVPFPAPRLVSDTSTEDEEKAAIAAIAGSERAAADFLRDSVTAPFVLQTRDRRDLPGGDIIRQVDLWFVIRAELDRLDPEKAETGLQDGQTVEAGNMRFSARRLRDDDARKRGVEPSAEGTRQWFLHVSGRLLDRIQVETTDRIVASQSPGSWLVATVTEPRFDDDQTAPNRWWPIARQGTLERAGASKPYAGGASYVRMTRLRSVPGAFLVESHFAFVEPHAWFQGAPLLRSKFSLIAQDRIRALRRELAKSREATRPVLPRMTDRLNPRAGDVTMPDLAISIREATMTPGRGEAPGPRLRGGSARSTRQE